MQRNSNWQPLCLQTNAEPFSQTGQVMTLCCEYLSLPHNEILILSNNDNGNNNNNNNNNNNKRNQEADLLSE